MSPACDDADRYQANLAAHDQLLRQHGLITFADHTNPPDVMNSVALHLGGWIQFHLDWSHHTIPQVSFLGVTPVSSPRFWAWTISTP